MKKYLVEFIGTFFLVLVIGLSGSMGVMAPIAIGSMLMVMIFAGGHISGAHYNPAITLAIWMRGKCETSDVPGYLVAQLLGGVLAAIIAGVLGGGAATASPMEINITSALLAEVLGTFALAYVILNVATAKGTANNSFYGLAIGFTVTAGAYAFGGISGGAFNPAVAVGASVMKAFAWSNIWVYLVANFGGAALAALVFKFTNGYED